MAPRRKSTLSPFISFYFLHLLLKRRGLLTNTDSRDHLIGKHEWWLTDLTRELSMSHLKLRDWAKRGWLHSRRTALKNHWILWAGKDELCRLRTLLAESRRGINAYASTLTTPKNRSAKPAADSHNC